MQVALCSVEHFDKLLVRMVQQLRDRQQNTPESQKHGSRHHWLSSALSRGPVQCSIPEESTSLGPLPSWPFPVLAAALSKTLKEKTNRLNNRAVIELNSALKKRRLCVRVCLEHGLLKHYYFFLFYSFF